ncbi:MAG TPA: ion channel, partial [Solirubrobacterales bacterium]|nr:ion channel [Solirubrobacterales bacterium]
EGIYWAVTTMTTLNSTIVPSTTGSEILSAFILLVGIAFVALLTGAFAQRFLGPELQEVEEELEAEALSAEALALRELHSVREQLEALEIAVERLVDKRAPR